jgi:hypothetical protein
MANSLGPGQELPKDQPLVSSNGRYRFVLQQDGNLVLYEGGHPHWSSETHGRAVSRCVMQTDGNLVIYGFNDPIWASGTHGSPGSYLILQDDRNVVIYKPNAPIWSTGTHL